MNDDFGQGYNLLECLDAIDPGSLDYTEWVNVGMALQSAGFAWDAWDTWSMRDAPRYHKGECERKWATFRPDGKITGGTLVEYARKAGWEPPEYDMGEALDLGGLF